VWFDKVKAITEEIGFTTDMKAYKADPTAFKGTVADVSTFIRQAVTGKTNSPDLYTVMQILGYARTVERIRNTIEQLY
jgi:glutamyl-tRNA synthetase